MLPSEIKIGAQTYSVIEDDRIGDDDECGHIKKTRNVIRIANNLPESQKEDTLLHEILHAVCFFVGIDDEEKLTEEQFVTRTCSMLLTVLKENGLFSLSK